MEALLKDKRYTYADYANWDTEDRYELIDGVPYMMASPTEPHQRIIGNLHYQLFDFLKGKPCRVYLSPFDVRLNAAGDDDDVVQPDILVVCDRAKIDRRGLNGAPDMAIEILLLSSVSHDRVRKFNKYLQTGVREYWIVDPDSKTAQVHILAQNGAYIVKSYGETDTVAVNVLEGCEISLPDVFSEA